MSDELALLDATAQAELVRQRKASPRELVDAAIARIERVNPKLNAVIIQRFEKARAEAAAPDLPAGPFRGVPFLLKALICHSAGDPYHAGMRLLRELKWVERYDTHLAARFRAAGFVFLGRTNVPELGPAPTTEPLVYGPTRNPWDTSRSPGGSSGGSAAPVAPRPVPGPPGRRRSIPSARRRRARRRGSSSRSGIAWRSRPPRRWRTARSGGPRSRSSRPPPRATWPTGASARGGRSVPAMSSP